MNLQPNANFNDLPDIHVNDFIHLIASGDTLLKCHVLAVSPETVKGIVHSVHHSDPSKDWKLISTPGTELVGTHVDCKRQFVHAVISG